MLKLNPIIFIIFTLLLNSCSSSNKSVDIRLHDIWALDSIEGEKIIIDNAIANLPVLEIFVEDERVHGNTSCNTMNGQVKIDNNQIAFLNIITTKMACPGDIENRFLSALQKVNNYKILKLKLYLYEDDKELLSLKKID